MTFLVSNMGSAILLQLISLHISCAILYYNYIITRFAYSISKLSVGTRRLVNSDEAVLIV